MSQSDVDVNESDVTEALEVLEAKLETYKQGLDNAWDAIDDLEEERDQLREENQQLHDRVDDLEDEVARLDARTDLLELVENADEMDGKQRSVALIQHLKRAAEKQRDRGERVMASVNRDEAESALHHPDVERTTIYRDMERAERLVGNKDVLEYNSASGGESRLRLNLERGDLPHKFTGGEEL